MNRDSDGEESLPAQPSAKRARNNDDVAEDLQSGSNDNEEGFGIMEDEQYSEAESLGMDEEDENLCLDIEALQQRFQQINHENDDDFDVNELQNLTHYNEIDEQQDDHSFPTEDFDEDTIIVDTEPRPSARTSSMDPPSRRSSVPDISEEVPHQRVRFENSEFNMALGLWCEQVGVSRSQFTSLREILRILEPNDHLKSLPNSLTTLKRRTKGQLPLLPMRKKNIPLRAEKIPTESATQKAAGNPDKIPIEALHFFDPKEMFISFLSSDIAAKIHIGMATYEDSPKELWSSHAWASSIRAASGDFAHSVNTLAIVFPSDWVFFQCKQADCNCAASSCHHVGRVWEVARDFRAAAPVRGAKILMLQLAISSTSVHTIQNFKKLSPKILPNELILTDQFLEISESEVHDHLEVEIDYSCEEDAEKVNNSEYQQQRLPVGKFARRQISNNDATKTRPLCHEHPPRAELEIRKWGRKHFTDLDGKKVLALPLITFIDGFGLYRNSYRSLMGIYLIMAGLTLRERTRRSNVLPLTLGPHGSNFCDVIGAMQLMTKLDEGLTADIKGKSVQLFAFTLMFIGDMPQQQENAGFRTQRANRGCRFCFIEESMRADLDFDIINEGRYHHQTIAMRDHLESIKGTRNQEKYASKWGLATSYPPLLNIAPALDIILSRPGDPAHSEYSGQSRRLHELLIEGILSPKAVKLYASFLRTTFPFPPTFARLQSPVHHLKSYSLSDHARWSIVIPILLACWLRDFHVQPLFLKCFRDLLITDGLLPFGSNNNTAVLSWVIRSYALAAKSNSILMADEIKASDSENLMDIVREGRKAFQRLLRAAADSINANPRSRSQTPSQMLDIGNFGGLLLPAPGSGSGQNVGQSRATTSRDAINEEKKRAGDYRNGLARPNVHTALHYDAIAREYLLPVHCNVLIGEDKHR